MDGKLGDNACCSLKHADSGQNTGHSGVVTSPRGAGVWICKREAMVQRFGTRRLLAPILVLLCATALIILWLDGKKPGIDLLASFVNAALFLALGIIVRDINLYRSSYKSFIEVFHGIESKLSSNGHGSFYVVLPQFRINPDVQRKIEAALESIDGPGKRIFDLYRNQSVYKYMPNHKVTLDFALAGNDSEAGILLASAIGALTQGSFTPIFKTDEGQSVDLDRPAILLGLYSNSWVHAYWDHVRHSAGVFRPLNEQVGFWVRSGKDSYKRFLPLGRDDQELADFWTQDSPDISTDYAIVARVRGNTAPNSVWLVCAGIGKAGTKGAAQYLTRDSVLRQIVKDFSESPEFALVLEVSARNISDAREVHCWPAGLRKVEEDRLQRPECDISKTTPESQCPAGDDYVAPLNRQE